MAELEVRVDARPAQRGSQAAVRSLDSIRDAARRTNRGMKDSERQFERTRRSAFSLSRVLGVLSVALVARAIFEYTDAFQRLSNRLRLVTDSAEEFNAVQQKVFEIAQRNRIGFESTTELFQRVARSSDQLGISMQRVLNVTDSVAKAITISGVSAHAANAAIVQLGQGLASGTLRGDELRSVLEQTPRLARAIADGLGLTIGQLRLYGQEGKLNSEKVITAMESQAALLESEFSDLEPTIGQAFTILRNSMIRTIGLLGESSGAAGGFARVVINLAEVIQGPLLQGILEFGDSLGIALDRAGRVVDTIVDGFNSLGIDIIPILQDIGRAILRIPLTVTRFIERALLEIDGFISTSLAKIELFKARADLFLKELVGSDGVTEAIRALLRAEGRLLIEESRLGSLRRDFAEENLAIEKQLTDAIEERAQARIRANAVDLSASGTGTGEISEELLKTREESQKMLDTLLEQEAALARAQAQGIEYSKALQQIRLEALAAQDADLGAAFLFDATQTIAEIERLEAAIDEHNEAENRARKIYDQNRTSAEKLAEALEELEALHMRFPDLIDEETLVREQQRLREEFSETKDILEELAMEAARNMQGALADFFFDPFEDGLEGLVNNFADALRRMAAEAAAQKIFEKLFKIGSGEGDEGGDGKVGFFKSLLGVFGNAKGFATGGEFKVGGSGGTDSQLVAFRASPHETVSVKTPAQQRDGGQHISVNQTFVLPPAALERANLRETQAQIGAQAFQSIRRANARNR